MPPTLVQSLCAAVVFAALASAGCSAKRPIAAAGPPFRLGNVYTRPVLFPPSIPESNLNSSAIHLQIEAPSSRASLAPDCVAEDGPFRVEYARHPDSFQIALPSAERWIANIRGIADPDGDAVASLYDVFAKLDQPRQTGCFANVSSEIRDFILQSLPMEPNETLFNYYGYRSSRNGLDLKPGMRLKVERAYLKSAARAGRASSTDDQEGVSFVYFDLESSSDATIHFRRDGQPRFTPRSLKNKFQNTGLESELASLPPELSYRLVFYGLHVPTEQKLSASIIGASSSTRLDEFERTLRSHPTLGCRNLTDTQAVSCLDFTGWVTATPQIRIELNGKPKFIDCGTPIRDVLPEGALNSLTMQRKFINSYRNVRFKSGDTNILSLALVGGDRLTWSTPPSAGR